MKIFTLPLLLGGLVLIATSSCEKDPTHPRENFRTGDTVYIDDINITGKINAVYLPCVDLIVVGSNGMPVELKYVNKHLIHKVRPSLEN